MGPGTPGPRGSEEVVGRIKSSEAANLRVPPMESLPLSQECKLAAGRAVKEAAKTKELPVATTHFVRAILKQETPPAARILRDRRFGRVGVCKLCLTMDN